MNARDSRRHLLWRALGTALEAGRGERPAFLAEGETVSYAVAAAAALHGGSVIGERFAPGARVVIATRDQLAAGLALLGVLAAGRVPLLADPSSSALLAAAKEGFGAAGGIGDPAVLEPAGLASIATDEVRGWVGAAAASPARLGPPAVGESDPAFWTFTSGTTGAPRAVVHGHDGPFAAYEAFARGVLELGPADRTIASGGLPFVYVLGNAFFFPLFAGAATILPRDLLLPTMLGELERQRATVLVSGPWSLSAIARLVPESRREGWRSALRGLRLVLSAGESLPAAVFEAWRTELGREVLDNLGCTEMFNSFVSCRPGEARAGSLGRVVPGFEIRVGGAAPRPGARGSLAVRGRSRALLVSRRAAGLVLEPPPGEWCETGDAVAVEADGSITFLGREDDRVKVKGRFVHPVEIERRLREVAGVADCLVAAAEGEQGVATIVATLVVDAGADAETVRRAVALHARRTLASEELPSRFEVAETLPRSARGKLLRK